MKNFAEEDSSSCTKGWNSLRFVQPGHSSTKKRTGLIGAAAVGAEPVEGGLLEGQHLW